MDVSSCFGSSSLLASSKCLSRSFCVFLRYTECKDFYTYYCCIDLYRVLVSTIFKEDSNSCSYSINTVILNWWSGMKSLMKDSKLGGLCIRVSINSIRNCLAESSALILKNIKLTFQGCRCLIILVISPTPPHCISHLCHPFTLPSPPHPKLSLCYQCVTCTVQHRVMTAFQGNISTVQQWTCCCEW